MAHPSGSLPKSSPKTEPQDRADETPRRILFLAQPREKAFDQIAPRCSPQRCRLNQHRLRILDGPTPGLLTELPVPYTGSRQRFSAQLLPAVQILEGGARILSRAANFSNDASATLNRVWG